MAWLSCIPRVAEAGRDPRRSPSPTLCSSHLQLAAQDPTVATGPRGSPYLHRDGFVMTRRQAGCDAFSRTCLHPPQPPARPTRVCSSCSTPVGLGAKSQALLQGSPLLRSFPLCSRLFLVGLLASEITSLLVLDHFHNVHCDAEFQCAG